MAPRSWLSALPLLLGATLACNTGHAPTPVTPAAVPAATSNDTVAGSSLPWGLYTARIDVRDGNLSADIAPVQPVGRSAMVIGDILTLEVAEYFQGSPCVDCFGVAALGRDLDGNITVDLRMRHPFRTTDAREDLDVFDPRVLVITDQDTTSYPALGPVLSGIDGSTAVDVSLQPDLLLNADGFTGHYDWIAENSEIVGTARNYAGSVNPYIDFFTEDDPDPEVEGTRIAYRRMPMASDEDVQRLVLSSDALVQRGGQFEALLLIEVAYGQPAIRAIPEGQPGSRKDPAYFLPAFNRKEAVLLTADPIADLTENIADVRTVDFAVADWQAGLLGVGEDNFALAPDYLNRGDVPFTSTLEEVRFSIPDLDPTLKTVSSFPTGDGTLDLPWTGSLSFSNVENPPAGTYYGVLAAVDSYHGTQSVPGFAYGSTQSFIRDFTTFQVVPVTVEPGTPNDPPVAQFKARKLGDPTWIEAPGLVTLTAGDTLEYTLADSTDDLNSWSAIAAHYDLDGSAGTGSNGGFEVIQLATTTVGTLAYPTAGNKTLRAKVRDDIGQFSAEESLTLVINPVPNNAPVAVLKARKLGDTTWTNAPGPLAIMNGDTVQFTLTDSTDDLGLWSNPAAHYDLDNNIVNGFEQTAPLITDIVTRTYSTNGAFPANAKVRDNLPQDSATVSMTINVSGGTPTCYTVTPIANLPYPTYEHSAETLNGKIYIAGGWSSTWPTLNKRPNVMWEYDPVANNYTQLPGTFRGIQPGEGRIGMEIFAVNNRLYLMGGEGTFLASCNYYNPVDYWDTNTNSWGTGANLNPSLWRCAGAVYNGRIWMPGGFREASSCYTAPAVNTTTVYNPGTNTWNSLNEFGGAIPAFVERRWAHSAAVINSKLYVLPGQYMTAGGAQGNVKTVQEYDLTTAGASWVYLDQCPDFRWLYEVEVVNNRAYIIGGLNNSGVGQSTIYQFDPSKPSGSQWTTLSTSCGSLPNAIYGSACAVYNGEIYVFGGALSLSNPTTASYKITLQ